MTFDIKRALVRELNMGARDRSIRYAAGAAIFLLSVFTGNILLLLVAGGLFATAYTRWCPVYSGLSKTTLEADATSTSGQTPAA